MELYVICLYRSPSLKSVEENEKLLSQIAQIPTDCEKNIVVVGDLNLPNVDWKQGIVSGPENTKDKNLALQREYLDLFIAKGFSWFIEDKITRIRKVGDNLQQSTLDQVLSNNENLVCNVETLAPLGKSDHLSLEVELNINVNHEFMSSKRKNWFKVDKDFVHSHAENIDWSYSSNANNVDSMWSELHQKMLSISEKVPEIKMKTNKRGDILEKLPWDTSRLVRKRKEKDRAWKAFDDNPYMNTFQTALYKQNEYASTELKEKLKYEKKIVGNLKTNTKPFFRYLKSKNKLRKTVKELVGSDGVSSKTPQETADILLDFFQSVFKAESAGPLPQKCFESANILNEPMAKPKIESETVKKLLTNLNPTKSMGPDNVHPKLLKFLADDDNFVTSLSLLLRECVEQECIPKVWKSAVVVPIHKKGSVHNPENYRPVSLTCILCKLYETILREHILKYVIGIITEKQHGFLPGKSCK